LINNVFAGNVISLENVILLEGFTAQMSFAVLQETFGA
jgi:hypothetical protein